MNRSSTLPQMPMRTESGPRTKTRRTEATRRLDAEIARVEAGLVEREARLARRAVEVASRVRSTVSVALGIGAVVLVAGIALRGVLRPAAGARSAARATPVSLPGTVAMLLSQLLRAKISPLAIDAALTLGPLLFDWWRRRHVRGGAAASAKDPAVASRSAASSTSGGQGFSSTT
jgi:hypothetical protein